MFGISYLFLFVIFKAFIAPDLAKEYLAGAVAIALFGTTSPATLATTVGVLTEVPVMLMLVIIANKTKTYFDK